MARIFGWWRSSAASISARVKASPPGPLDGVNLGPVALGHVHQAQTEVALDGNKNAVARFNGVGQGGLHRRTAGATHRNGEAVVGLPGVAQQLLHLAHQLDVERIEVTDRAARQGGQHGGMGIGRAWTQQQPFRGGDRSDREAMTVADGGGGGLGDQGQRREWKRS